MSGDDEQELRSRLDTALMTLTPRPAPIDAVMRQGRRMIGRRRSCVAGGFAAVAIAAVAVPAALHQHAGRPASTPPAVVTVLRPGPGSVAGLIASGTVGAMRWSVRVTGKDCVAVAGAASTGCGVPPHLASLVTVYGVGGGSHTTQYGPVRSAVTRVTVQLGDGQVLVLRPVRAAGARWIAFPVPAGTEVRRVTAYGDAAELGYAIPFNGPTGTSNLPGIITWLAPGAAEHPRVRTRLGSGVAEYAGPWGRCFVAAAPDGFSSDCTPGFGSQLRNGQPVSVLMAPSSDSTPRTYLATAGAQVSRVTVSVSDGQVLQPSIIRGADGEKFFTYTVGAGQKALRWTAYGTDGQPLGSGNAGLN